MGRDFQTNGETMVYVKGHAGSLIPTLTEFGLSDGPVTWSQDSRFLDIAVDAWGQEIPPEVQYLLGAVNISMTLVHYDEDVLDEVQRLSMAGGGGVGTAVGLLPRAGARMGNNLPRFGFDAVTGLGNNFIGLNLASPVDLKPYRFFYAYLIPPAVEKPLGTHRSLTRLNWRAIPYTVDPWNAGLGAFGQGLWDNILDS